MTNPHAAITTVTSGENQIPTMTLAKYSYSTTNDSFLAGNALNKGAKIEYTATDDLVITSRQGLNNANDTMTMSDGTTTFSTCLLYTSPSPRD